MDRDIMSAVEYFSMAIHRSAFAVECNIDGLRVQWTTNRSVPRIRKFDVTRRVTLEMLK